MEEALRFPSEGPQETYCLKLKFRAFLMDANVLAPLKGIKTL